MNESDKARQTDPSTQQEGGRRGKRFLAPVIWGIVLCLSIALCFVGFRQSSATNTLRAAPEGISAVIVDTRNIGVRVVRAEGNEIVITYYTDDAIKYNAEVKDGEVTLMRRPDGATMWLRDLLSFLRGKKNVPDIEIALPARYAARVGVVTTNGGISLASVEGLGDVMLRTSNGGVTLTDMSAALVDASTTNGGVTLSGVTAATVNADTTNGGVTVNGVSAGNVDVSTSNGVIRVNGASVRGGLSARTTNGLIDVREISAEQYMLTTTNSPVTGELPGVMADYDINSGTTNGSNSLPARQHGVTPLTVKTVNGNISLRFTGE